MAAMPPFTINNYLLARFTLTHKSWPQCSLENRIYGYLTSEADIASVAFARLLRTDFLKGYACRTRTRCLTPSLDVTFGMVGVITDLQAIVVTHAEPCRSNSL